MAPFPQIGVGEWMFTRLQDLSKEDKIAQISAEDGSSWTFSKLFEHTVHAAVGLQEIGLKSGKSVLTLIIPTSHEVFPIVMASFMADIPIIPTYAELSAESLAEGLNAGKCTHILTDPDTAGKIEEAISLSKLDPPPKILVLTQDIFKDIIAKGSHVDPENYKPAKVRDLKTHVAAYFFSSGTTGPPKLLSISHYGLMRSLFGGSKIVLRNNGPMLTTSLARSNWNILLFALGRSLVNGRVRVFMDYADEIQTLDAIQKYKCDLWFVVPRQIYAVEKVLTAHPGRWDMSSLEIMFSAGSCLTAPIQKRCSEAFNADIHQQYASSEGGLIFITDVFKPAVPGSIGRPCVPVKLVDPETGAEIKEPNKPGELFSKDWMLIEYVDNPKATEDAIKGDWLPSGDLIQFDQNRDYFFVDRIKEIFNCQGHQVNPSELETLISGMPEVLECAIVGKRDPNFGERPFAFIVKRPGFELKAEDIDKVIEKSPLPDWYELRGGVIFLDKLPSTGSGKVAKKKLRDYANNRRNSIHD